MEQINVNTRTIAMMKRIENMITQELIDRINELARKAKTEEGLTEEEKAEREVLRRQYIDAFKENLRAQLERIELVDPEEKSKGKLS